MCFTRLSHENINGLTRLYEEVAQRENVRPMEFLGFGPFTRNHPTRRSTLPMAGEHETCFFYPVSRSRRRHEMDVRTAAERIIHCVDHMRDDSKGTAPGQRPSVRITRQSLAATSISIQRATVAPGRSRSQFGKDALLCSHPRISSHLMSESLGLGLDKL